MTTRVSTSSLTSMPSRTLGSTPPPSGDERRQEAPPPFILLELQGALLAAAYVKLADPGRILS